MIELDTMLKGRKKLFTAVEKITAENVVQELSLVLPFHFQNIIHEDYLKLYTKGIQPILEKEKKVRPEINHKVTVNIASNTVVFKNGYFLTKPASYISRREDDNVIEQVKKLNEYIYTGGKQIADNKVVNNFHTTGLGVLYVEPNDDEKVPFKVYSLQPQSAFVVYSLNAGNKPVYAVNMVVYDETAYYDVWTKDSCFRLKSVWIKNCVNATDVTTNILPTIAFSKPSIQRNTLGVIPIVEYYANENRTSCFELGIPILNAINDTESLRQDGIDQFIQSLLVLYNCDLEDGVTAKEIRQAGLIKLKSTEDFKADIKEICQQLDQTQTQVTIDDLQAMYDIVCCMPIVNKSGGGSSDNGSAVYLRENYASCDTEARNTADNFKECNRYFDEIILEILKKKRLIDFDLSISDFDLKIEPNTSSNLLVKSQSALNMKMLGFAPQIVFERSGLSSDPLNDYEISKEYIDRAWGITQQANNIQENNEIQKVGLQENESDLVERVNVE